MILKKIHGVYAVAVDFLQVSFGGEAPVKVEGSWGERVGELQWFENW